MRFRTLLLIAGAALLAPDLLGAQQANPAAPDPSLVGDGARVWAATCTRCHNARPSTERDDRQWATIMAHMRARANLTRRQTRLVTAFLQATNADNPAYATTTPPVRGAERADAQGPPAQEPPGDGRAQAEDPPPPAEQAALLRYLRSVGFAGGS